MRKRAEISFGTAVMWVLGIFVLLVLIYIFYGPEQLWSGIRAALFSFGFGSMPGDREPTFRDEPLVSNEQQLKFDHLVNELTKEYSQKTCLIRTENELFVEGKKFVLVKGEVKVTRINDKGGLSPSLESKDIPNYTPCIVDSENFYKYYVDEETANKKEYENTIKIADTLTINEVTIEYKNEHYLYDADLLFKQGDNICFILIHNGERLNPIRWITDYGCDATENTIDNDCLKSKYTNKIGFCDESIPDRKTIRAIPKSGYAIASEDPTSRVDKETVTKNTLNIYFSKELPKPFTPKFRFLSKTSFPKLQGGEYQWNFLDVGDKISVDTCESSCLDKVNEDTSIVSGITLSNLKPGKHYRMYVNPPVIGSDWDQDSLYIQFKTSETIG